MTIETILKGPCFMAKKKAKKASKKKVGLNDYVTTYKVVERKRYSVVASRTGYGITASESIETNDADEAHRLAYENAMAERKSRRLEQGDLRVMFPNGIVKE